MRSFLLCLVLIPSLLFGQDSLFTANQTPGSHFNEPDKPVELGVIVKVQSAGYFSAIKWFASVGGEYTANLYKGTDKIYTTSFQASARGWVSIPVNIEAEPGEYTASVFAANGRYGSRNWVFSSSINSGELIAPVSAGRYSYGTQSTYPTEVYRNCSYYVDVVFKKANIQPPTPTPIFLSAGLDSTLVLSLDTVGSTPSVNYSLSASGPDSLTYQWEEWGDTSFKATGKVVPIVFNYVGTHIYIVTGTAPSGAKYQANVFVRVDGNPKDVVIELLRDGTYRVVEKNAVLLVNALPVERPIP